MIDYQKNFVEKLNMLIINSGKSKMDIAAGAGITNTTLSNVLHYRNTPSFFVIYSLAKYFKVSIDWMVGNEVIENGKPV